MVGISLSNNCTYYDVITIISIMVKKQLVYKINVNHSETGIWQNADKLVLNNQTSSTTQEILDGFSPNTGCAIKVDNEIHLYFTWNSGSSDATIHFTIPKDIAKKLYKIADEPSEHNIDVDIDIQVKW